MQLKFWGVRGSIPSPIAVEDINWRLRSFINLAQKDFNVLSNADEFIKRLPRWLAHPVGGNTPCVEVRHKKNRVILDMGSGIRYLGNNLGKNKKDKQGKPANLGDSFSFDKNISNEKDKQLSIFLSHTHWDHIQGFPFFPPVHDNTYKINIYGYDGESIRKALQLQQTSPFMFPISFDNLAANINCLSFPPEGLKIGEIEVSSFALPHPGGSRAYKLKADGKTIVYATDYEFINHSSGEADHFIKFINNADILISDTQYTYLEGISKEGWGHSTSFYAFKISVLSITN